HKLTPPLEVEVDTQETQGKLVIRVQVPRGDDPPYALDDNKIYVRDETETTLAVRDEIVRLVQKNPRVPRSEPVAEPSPILVQEAVAVEDGGEEIATEA